MGEEDGITREGMKGDLIGVDELFDNDEVDECEEERLFPNRFFRCANGEVGDDEERFRVDLPSSPDGDLESLIGGPTSLLFVTSNSKYIYNYVEEKMIG